MTIRLFWVPDFVHARRSSGRTAGPSRRGTSAWTATPISGTRSATRSPAGSSSACRSPGRGERSRLELLFQEAGTILWISSPSALVGTQSAFDSLSARFYSVELAFPVLQFRKARLFRCRHMDLADTTQNSYRTLQNNTRSAPTSTPSKRSEVRG